MQLAAEIVLEVTEVAHDLRDAECAGVVDCGVIVLANGFGCCGRESEAGWKRRGDILVRVFDGALLRGVVWSRG